MHISPYSWALKICKNIGIQTYLGSITVESVRDFCHFAFWRHWFKLATFCIAPKHCIFWGASLKLSRNLATLNPENLQGFHGIPLSHCHTLKNMLSTQWHMRCMWKCQVTVASEWAQDMRMMSLEETHTSETYAPHVEVSGDCRTWMSRQICELEWRH